MMDIFSAGSTCAETLERTDKELFKDASGGAGQSRSFGGLGQTINKKSLMKSRKSSRLYRKTENTQVLVKYY